MKDIKDTILLLCNVINKTYNQQILTSHFRHAKFNRNDDNCIGVLWQVVHAMVCEETSCSSDIVDCVKLSLLKLGYNMVSFFGLPKCKSYGSQDLLLALSWLISIDKIEEGVDNKLFESVLIQEFPKVSKANYTETVNGLSKDFNSSQEFINSIILKSGILRQKLFHLEEKLMQRLRGIKKIHKETNNIVGISHLSTLEVYILSEKRLEYSRYLHCLRETIDVIEAYMLWSKKIKIYFMWMESVIDQRLSNTQDECDKAKVIKEFNHFVDPTPNIFHHYKFMNDPQSLDENRTSYKNLTTSEISGILDQKSIVLEQKLELTNLKILKKRLKN